MKTRLSIILCFFLISCTNDKDANLYRSNGEGNSKGLDFTIEHPESFVEYNDVSGKKNLVQAFINPEEGLSMIVYVMQHPGDLTKDRIDTLLSKTRIEAIIYSTLKDPDIITFKNGFEINGKPAAMCDFRQTLNNVSVFSRYYFIAIKEHTAMVSYEILPIDTDDVNVEKNLAKFQAHIPMFESSINTFKVHNE